MTVLGVKRQRGGGGRERSEIRVGINVDQKAHSLFQLERDSKYNFHLQLVKAIT